MIQYNKTNKERAIMIEIVLDGNSGNEFCGNSYPIIEIEKQNDYTWESYKELARTYIHKYKDEKAIIIYIKDDNFSLNKLSLALFVESIKNQTNLENAVFKVTDLTQARQNYYPYVALTIAIKYVLKWLNETPSAIYKSISELGYLDLDIKRSYAKNTLSIKYEGSSEPVYNYNTSNVFDALAVAGLLKAISLAKVKACFNVEMILDETPQNMDTDTIVEKIIKDVSPWID